MEIELSNFQERAIPKSCPAAIRARIEAVRAMQANRTAKAEVLSVEADAETLKQVCSTLE